MSIFTNKKKEHYREAQIQEIKLTCIASYRVGISFDVIVLSYQIRSTFAKNNSW